MKEKNIIIARIELAMCRINQNPFLLIFVLPIPIATVLIWVKMEYILDIFDVPQIIASVYRVAIEFIGVLIPLLFLVGILYGIGFYYAYDDERDVREAFEDQGICGKSFVLVYKKKDKKTNIFISKWKSSISLGAWINNINNIEHHMIMHLVKKLEYDTTAKDNRIVMCYKKGMRDVKVGKPIYDLTLEKDMEKY